LRILLHGSLAQAIGRDLEVAASEGASVGDLRRRLAADHPAAAATLARSRVYASDRFVDDGQALCASDEIEFLPPVSGG